MVWVILLLMVSFLGCFQLLSSNSSERIGSLSSRAQSLADQNERDGRNRAMNPAVMRVAAGFPVSKGMYSGILRNSGMLNFYL